MASSLSPPLRGGVARADGVVISHRQFLLEFTHTRPLHKEAAPYLIDVAAPLLGEVGEEGKIYRVP